MPGGVRVHLYCFCWNDARLLPYFFRHYDEFVDEYFVFDNGSTDASLSLLKDHGRVHVEHFEVAGDSFVEEERRLSDQIWQKSRGTADWVIVTDIDEHLYRPYMIGYLAHCKAEGVTAIKSHGYEMVADSFPAEEEKLVNLVTRGCRSVEHDRLCIFNPNAITSTRFSASRHRAWPEGHVVWPSSPEVLLLHYRQLGVKYVSVRSAELARGIKTRDIENGWGTHFLWSAQEIVSNWARLKAESVPVPGLGELRHVPPEDFRGDEKIIDQSDLLDGDWYLAANPDLAESQVDPLVHFCQYGWHEGRRPNFYFDPAWYADAYPQSVVEGGNPFIHYVRQGESAGDWPSRHFDTEWYREQHNLAGGESPLRHYLLRRGSGQVSPVPDFDLEGYCNSHPEVVAAGRDPYEDYILRTEAPATEAEGEHFPAFGAVAATLGLDPALDVYPASVSWRSLLEVIQLFLQRFPVDEVWYREAYPDVDEAIRNGQIESARRHFIEYGYFEGRDFRPPEGGPEGDDGSTADPGVNPDAGG